MANILIQLGSSLTGLKRAAEMALGQVAGEIDKLQGQVDTLKDRVATLEAQVADHEARIVALEP
jgi:predicted  nucleic acid-binding Zn-ribbon protein